MQVSRDTLATKSRVWTQEQAEHGLKRPAAALTHPLSLPPFTEPIASNAARERTALARTGDTQRHPAPPLEAEPPNRRRYPPIGARGFAPQKIWVPSIPMMWTETMLTTMDFAVAVPTPTGPPLAVKP